MADGGGCDEVVVAENTETGDDTLFGPVVGECTADERRILDEEEPRRSLITRCLTGGTMEFIDAGTPNVGVDTDGPTGGEWR